MSPAKPDLWSLYGLMLKSRLFEKAVARLWHDGLISGEMHLGTGEEAIVAGILAHVRDGDALALDHRGTPPLIMRGVDPAAIILEMLGHPDGLCGGMGGHMHLFSKPHLAASSGIVGSAGPTAVGFALATRYLRPGSLAVSFFGDAAINQGMVMESLNLAASWRLPVLFVCKDDRWGITTDSGEMTGADIARRSAGLGVPVVAVDGRDVTAVWQTASDLITQIREDGGPRLLHASCVHLDGHFLGYQMMRVVQRPLRELPPIAWPLMRAFLRRDGGGIKERWAGLKLVLQAMWATVRDPRKRRENDPLWVAKRKLVGKDGRLQQLEADAQNWLAQALNGAGLEGRS